MARLSTCKGCGKQLTKEEKYTLSGKSYCKECNDRLVYESEQRKLLLDSLCKYMNIDFPTGLILKQVKEYKEVCGYNYAAMNYTLWYYVNILNKIPQQKYGLAFIKYHYEDAKNYYTQQEYIKKSMEKSKDVEIKTKIVTINKANGKKELLLDLNNLLSGARV